MGRHASASASAPPSALRSRPAVLGAAGLALVLIGGGMWWASAGDDDGGCERPRTVRVTVAPEVEDLVRGLLRDAAELPEGECAVAEVTAQRPLQTVGDLGALDAGALPEVWVPDSSLWTARVTDVPLDASGSLGSTPVVLATSRAAVEELGWDAEPPSWSAALSGVRPVALPDLATSAEGLSALGAVGAFLGDGTEADNAVVEVVLAAQRGAAVDPEDGLAAAAEGAADAPLVPVTEQRVVTATREVADPQLVAVYPAEGSPVLDHPVVRVGGPADAQRPAVDAVVRALTSKAARAAALEAGFRTSDGAPEGVPDEAPEVLAIDPEGAAGLLARLQSLQVPSRLLAVFDVSTSMEASVGRGTRATLARDAAKSALGLFPRNTAIGLWFFASRLSGDDDWEEVVPVRTLTAESDGATQAELLGARLDELPDRLTPGGTGLYDTTLAAVRAARESYDPDAVNSVVVVTDGKNEDDGTPLRLLLDTLRAEADPDRPVKVIGIALGPDADLGALERIAAATGGAAYSAVEEEDLQTVLFDALRRRD